MDSSTKTPLLDLHDSVDYDFILKILIVGDSGAGKTQLFSRFADETFAEDHRMTQSVEYRHRYIEKNRFRCKAQVWDCISSASPAVMNCIYKGTNAVVLCFDLTNRESLDAVPDWVDEIHGYAGDSIHISLVGTKIDSPDRCISFSEGEEIANSLNLRYFETSAKTGEGVEQVFVNIVSELQPSAMSALFDRDDEDGGGTKGENRHDSNESSSCCCCVVS